jgi:hypothetical protein
LIDTFSITSLDFHRERYCERKNRISLAAAAPRGGIYASLYARVSLFTPPRIDTKLRVRSIVYIVMTSYEQLLVYRKSRHMASMLTLRLGLRQSRLELNLPAENARRLKSPDRMAALFRVLSFSVRPLMVGRT